MVTKKVIEFKDFNWIDITNPDKATMTELAEEYSFHPLDVHDCLTVSQRSNIDIYDEYDFMVLLFPVYDRDTGEIEPAELNFFISPTYIITVHHNSLPVFNEYFELFQNTQGLREQFSEKTPERLLYSILEKLYAYVYPMIDHLSDDCNTIQKGIFHGNQEKMVSRILEVRRNIIDFRKIMQVHKNVIKKLITELKQNKKFLIKKTDVYFESLVDDTKEIWDALENLKERIEALQETNESQISFQLSDLMKRLTIISVIMLPATLIAGLFGMNTVVPFQGNPDGFWYLISIVAILVLGQTIYFKYKRWL